MSDVTRYEPENDPFAAYAKTVSNQHILGKLLKFSKGDYIAGENSTPVPLGTRLVANMDSLLAGYIKWQDNRPVEHLMGLVAKGFMVPARNSLGDLDQDAWELDENGKVRDPWQKANYLLLRAEDGAIDDDRPVSDPTHALYTFTASSQGGLDAIANVCKAYNLDMRRQRPDMYPVIELGADSYLHRNRAYGRIKKPILTVIDWAPKSLFPDTPDANTAPTSNGGGNGHAAQQVAAPKPAPVVAKRVPIAKPAPATVEHVAEAASAPAPAPRAKPRF